MPSTVVDSNGVFYFTNDGWNMLLMFSWSKWLVPHYNQEMKRPYVG